MSEQRKKSPPPVIREPAGRYAIAAEPSTAPVGGVENIDDTFADTVAVQRKKNEGAIRLLESWRECTEEEAQEQRETWEYLKKVLDEDRSSYRKLFP